MSTRREIKDGSSFDVLDRGIVYTELLGWIDMGHARGNDVAALRRQFASLKVSVAASHLIQSCTGRRWAFLSSNRGLASGNFLTGKSSEAGAPMRLTESCWR